MEVINILNKFEDEIEEAPSIPFSNKKLLDKEMVEEFIAEMRANLPEDIKKAKWIQEERAKILSESKAERERILEEANEERLQLIDESVIVAEAQEQAKRIIEEANSKAINIRMGAKEYVDGILMEMSNMLNQKIEEIEINRRELEKY